MERKTYRDNNGFLRYEDTCKLVPTQSGNNDVIGEMWRIIKRPQEPIIHGDYEELILARQEEDF